MKNLTGNNKNTHAVGGNYLTLYGFAVVILLLIVLIVFTISNSLLLKTPQTNTDISTSPPSAEELRNEAWQMCFDAANAIASTGRYASFDYSYALNVYTPFCQDDYAQDFLSGETQRGVLRLDNNR